MHASRGSTVGTRLRAPGRCTRVGATCCAAVRGLRAPTWTWCHLRAGRRIARSGSTGTLANAGRTRTLGGGPYPPLRQAGPPRSAVCRERTAMARPLCCDGSTAWTARGRACAWRDGAASRGALHGCAAMRPTRSSTSSLAGSTKAQSRRIGLRERWKLSSSAGLIKGRLHPRITAQARRGHSKGPRLWGTCAAASYRRTRRSSGR
mmetsp:Transcript_18725/g.48229  ORF Transcript_18725/g.48229 Transcript_18725/m.48229 type:complete len:206 (-) Transcript_18725:903-1520(-)